jgi:hypothetical protein
MRAAARLTLMAGECPGGAASECCGGADYDPE